MEYSPPPLFKQGVSALVKMMVFAFISILLLFVDARFDTLRTLRTGAATLLYPLQMAALLPRDLWLRAGAYFSSLSQLENQVQQLQIQQIAAAQQLQQAQFNLAENRQFRLLLEAKERLPVPALMAEMLYDTRDVSSRKVVLNRGSLQGVLTGRPVIDNLGVVGQVTRVFPLTSEVTLLTDREQAIPVLILRSGLRSVAYGSGAAGTLELRFTAPNADIVSGDLVVTSGLDGVYPAGLAVAKVTLVENHAGGAFGRVICQPLGGIDSNTQLLVLMAGPVMAERPPAPEEFKNSKKHPVKPAPPSAVTSEEKK